MNTEPTLTIHADGIAYSVRFDRWDALQSNRARWQWIIGDATADAATLEDAALAMGDDLTTVVLRDPMYPNAADALDTLLTFLAAWLDDDSMDTFPAELRPALGALDSDDVTMLAELIGRQS